MKKLAVVLSFVFATAMIAPAFAQDGKKTVAKETATDKGCAKECAKTCSSKEAKACCSKESKETKTADTKK